MMKFAITAVEQDGAEDVVRGKVQLIVGGDRNVPTLAEEFEILDRIQLVDIVQDDDELFALVERDGQRLPPHEVTVRRDSDGTEHIESVHDGQVTDALQRLPRLPRE